MIRRKSVIRPAKETYPNNMVLTRSGKQLLKIRFANTFLTRLRGLLGRCPLGPDEALVIKPCRSIHTYGMKYTIDVAFLNSVGEVLVLATVKPSSTAFCNYSVAVVEMAEGTANRLLIQVGETLLLEGKQWH